MTYRSSRQQSDLDILKAILGKFNAGYEEITDAFYIFPRDNVSYTLPIKMREGFDRPVKAASFHQTNIVDAFRQMLDTTHVKYVIHSGIKGEVNLVMHDTTVGEVFGNLLGFSNAVSRFRNGVFHLYPRREFFTPEGKEIECFREDYDFENTDIRRALSEVCMSSGAWYTIPPDVERKVSLRLRQVTFIEALRAVIKQCSLAYTVQKGVFSFSKFPPAPGAFGESFVGFRGEPIGLQKEMLSRKISNLKLPHTDLREAIKRLCRAADVPYSLGEGVEGIVDISFKNSTFGKALHALIGPAGCDYVFDHQSFAIMPDPSMKRSLPTYEFLNKPAQDAVFELLSTLRTNFWISPKLAGTVNLKYGNRSFESELEDLLKQTNSTYRDDHGVFVIYPKLDPPKQVVLPNDDLIDGTFPYIEYKNADVREVLKTLFRALNANYSLDSRVAGTVTLHLEEFRYEAILDYICSSVNAEWRFEHGIFVVTPHS